ncbi:hypothetical protein VP168E361_P0069 [Vibrio phage 168E36-1]|nr:hypothetical protein VP168E361_P0069 [Vibrio phage 168E36-1]
MLSRQPPTIESTNKSHPFFTISRHTAKPSRLRPGSVV